MAHPQPTIAGIEAIVMVVVADGEGQAGGPLFVVELDGNFDLEWFVRSDVLPHA
jgi:hypothetical protein